jgi:hypothetical protein
MAPVEWGTGLPRGDPYSANIMTRTFWSGFVGGGERPKVRSLTAAHRG